jgi:hypothetical protein
MPAQGHKFSVGLLDAGGARVGVAIVGRAVARNLDDGRPLEVTRLATDVAADRSLFRGNRFTIS